jgi:hypothetical protein
MSRGIIPRFSLLVYPPNESFIVDSVDLEVFIFNVAKEICVNTDIHLYICMFEQHTQLKKSSSH